MHFERKFSVFSEYNLEDKKKCLPLHSQSRTMHCRHDGAIAQLVEQRTENPCVPGSIPGGTTKKELLIRVTLFFVIYHHIAQLVEQRTVSTYKLAL